MKLFPSKFDRLAIAIIFFFVIVFAALSIGRHAALKSYLNDLGTYDQLVWNTARGYFFEASANMLNIKNYLGAHFSPILLFFVPFYVLRPRVEWLLLFQVLSVGLGAFPIYWLAREKMKSFLAPSVFLLSYFLNPFIHNGVLYDFHEVVFAAGFASFAFYFLEKKNDKYFIVFASLLALSQEHLPLLVFMMGIWAAIVQKRYRFGLAVCAFSLLYFILVLTAFMPYFSESGKPALLSNSSQYGPRYAWLGSTPFEILKNIFSNPIEIIRVIASADRLKYLFFLITPLFSLALFSWPIMIILPALAINLLSSNSMTYSVFFYHSAILIPFLYFSATETFRRWFAGDRNLRIMFLGLILASSLIMSVFFSVSPLSLRYTWKDYLPDAHAKMIREIKRLIPPDASLSVQHNLGPHFSERRYAYRFPLEVGNAEYVLVDQTDPYRENPNQIFQFEYALQMNKLEWQSQIEELKRSDKYGLIYDNDGYLLFKSKFQSSNFKSNSND